MTLHIANPTVVHRVERLAKSMGLTKTALIVRALDRLEETTAPESDGRARMAALLAQLDQIPDRTDGFNPLDWDERGLPR